MSCPLPNDVPTGICVMDIWRERYLSEWSTVGLAEPAAGYAHAVVQHRIGASASLHAPKRSEALDDEARKTIRDEVDSAIKALIFEAVAAYRPKGPPNLDVWRSEAVVLMRGGHSQIEMDSALAEARGMASALGAYPLGPLEVRA